MSDIGGSHTSFSSIRRLVDVQHFARRTAPAENSYLCREVSRFAEVFRQIEDVCRYVMYNICEICTKIRYSALLTVSESFEIYKKDES